MWFDRDGEWHTVTSGNSSKIKEGMKGASLSHPAVWLAHTVWVSPKLALSSQRFLRIMLQKRKLRTFQIPVFARVDQAWSLPSINFLGRYVSWKQTSFSIACEGW